MIEVKSYPEILRFLDKVLEPLMLFLSGAPNEKPQETHKWNLQNISLEKRGEIDLNKATKIDGTYDGYLKENKLGPLFHMPIFGGWKDYIVLEVHNDTNSIWHLGWLWETKRRTFFQVNKLRLSDPKVRALKPPAGTSAFLFALNDKGNQLPLTLTGEGKIGDGKFSNIRLL